MVAFPRFNDFPGSTWAVLVKDEADFKERAKRWNAGDKQAFKLLGTDAFCDRFGADGMILAALNPKSKLFDIDVP